MDYYLALLTKTNDTKEKLTLGQDILAYLQSGASIECQDIGMVVDGILPFIQSSNFKVLTYVQIFTYLLILVMFNSCPCNALWNR